MPGNAENNSGRRWRGQTADERRTGRRAALIEAGIELFGTRGYLATSVKAVCDEAGLTERYFYETFEDREDLLAAIYDLLIQDSATAVLEALLGHPDDLKASIAAALEAFANQVTKDPRRARIQEIEVVGVSAPMEEKRRGAIHAFADLIVAKAREMGAKDRQGQIRLDVIAIGLVGAVNEQLVDYVLGHLDLPLEDLVANQVAVFDALASVLIPAN